MYKRVGVALVLFDLFGGKNQDVHRKKPALPFRPEGFLKLDGPLEGGQVRFFHNRQVQVAALVRSALRVRAEQDDFVRLALFHQDLDDSLNLRWRDHLKNTLGKGSAAAAMAFTLLGEGLGGKSWNGADVWKGGEVSAVRLLKLDEARR